MAPPAFPKVPASATERLTRAPALAKGVRLRDGLELTESIADLIGERRAIRQRVARGTGVSMVDDARIRAIDMAIDHLWADLRRQRLPVPAPPPPARPPARRVVAEQLVRHQPVR